MAGLEDEEPTAWAIRSANIQFHRPARLDDVIHVRTRLVGLSGARIHALQRVTCGEVLLVEGRIEACITTLTGKPRRLPKNIQETLAPFLAPDET
jgi:acyl-CoA thioester hydrolase